jgi:tetratricopeptide (TPR) repeat protein
LLLDREESEKEHKIAFDYAEKAYRNFPESETSQRNLAACNVDLGKIEIQYRQRVESGRKYLLTGLSLWEKLAKKLTANPNGDPNLPEAERANLDDTEEAIAHTCDQLGLVVLNYEVDYAKAEEWFNKSLTLRKNNLARLPSRDRQTALEDSYKNLANLAMQRDELAKAISFHEEVVKLSEAVYAGRRWSMKARRELAFAKGDLGDDLMLAHRDQEGHQIYMESLKLFQQILAAEPGDLNYSSMLAHAHYRSGTSFIRLGDPKSARLQFDECLKLRNTVYEAMTDDQQKLNSQPEHMFALARCGKHAEAAEMAANVRKNLGRKPVHLAEVGACYGLCRAAVGEGKPEAALTPEEKQLRKKYLDLALESFEEARKKNYKDILFLEKDADFEALRGIPEYETWLASFRESIKMKK